MVVSDASPLILLAKIDLLEAFIGEFPERVLIPPQVQTECCATKDTFDAQLIARLIKERHIVVRKLKSPGVAAKIRKEFNLGKGEAEVIALAQTITAKLILIEDRNGMNACKILKLPFTGVLGILVRMHEKKLVSTEEAVRKLDLLERYGRYKADIIADVRRRLEAMK